MVKKRLKCVAGLDEAGRGPLAGPVIAAALTIEDEENKRKLKIRDSKKLSPKVRETIYKALSRQQTVKWGTGRVSEKVIDRINILEATKLAMIRAVGNLSKKLKKNKIDFLILDGNFKIDLPIQQKSIIKADEKFFSCSFASIIAKVTRDRIMERYHKKYPQYGFDKHKGYPTKLHFKMIRKYGLCKIHRKSFKLF